MVNQSTAPQPKSDNETQSPMEMPGGGEEWENINHAINCLRF